MLEKRFRSSLSLRIQSIAQFLVSLGVTANMVTMVGFLLSIVAGVFLGYGRTATAGILFLVGGSLDFFDGSIARARGIKDRSGALLDSVIDRYAEVAVFIGAAIFFHVRGQMFGLLFVLVTMPGSLLVSYVRARAEGLRIECKVGLMQRPERIVMIGAGLILDPVLMRYWGPDHLLLLVVFGVLAITTQWTAMQRLVYSFRELKRHPISE